MHGLHHFGGSASGGVELVWNVWSVSRAWRCRGGEFVMYRLYGVYSDRFEAVMHEEFVFVGYFFSHRSTGVMLFDFVGKESVPWLSVVGMIRSCLLHVGYWLVVLWGGV